uniref:ORF6C domain-containing protein n=1 Tax=Streptococcus pluranimalium TaxID=82348 RepID=UPI003F68D1C5
MTKDLSKMNKNEMSEEVSNMTIEDMMIQVLTSQKQVKRDVEEVRQLAMDIDKKVHIDDVEASEIKSIISGQAYIFAKQYFERLGKTPSTNLFNAKKGQFIRLQHSRLKRHFNVTKYTHIKHTEATQAFQFLKSLTLDSFTIIEIRETPKQLEIMALEQHGDDDGVA